MLDRKTGTTPCVAVYPGHDNPSKNLSQVKNKKISKKTTLIGASGCFAVAKIYYPNFVRDHGTKSQNTSDLII